MFDGGVRGAAEACMLKTTGTRAALVRRVNVTVTRCDREVTSRVAPDT